MLRWTFENNTNLHTVKILITDPNGNPINNAKVLFNNYGNRITWEEGIAIYRGVSAGVYDLTVTVNGVEMATEQLTVGSVDIDTTIKIATTDVTAIVDTNKIKITCFYDKTLDCIRVKSSQPLSSYKLFDSVGKFISEGKCFGTYFNIGLSKISSKFFIIQFITSNGSKEIVKCS